MEVGVASCHGLFDIPPRCGVLLSPLRACIGCCSRDAMRCSRFSFTYKISEEITGNDRTSARPTEEGSRKERYVIKMACKLKYLLVFDFDETIVNENSDDSVVQVAPEEELPDWLRETFQEGFYNQYMQRVFKYLGDKGVKLSDLKAVYEKIPLSPGMPTLFRFLIRNQDRFEIILLSDANMFGIESNLKGYGYHTLFRRVISNPTTLEKNGYLTLAPYHTHGCPQCPANMCKRKILTEYLAERAQEGVKFESLLYVGDGANDFCPSVIFTSTDVTFPRKSYPMHKLIRKMEEKQKGSFKAKVVPWESADVVAQYLQALLNKS